MLCIVNGAERRSQYAALNHLLCSGLWNMDPSTIVETPKQHELTALSTRIRGTKVDAEWGGRAQEKEWQGL
jgi:hypothetical protein